MKKIIAILLAAMMVIGLAACGEKQDAAAISIYKLGDGTDDAVLASEDLAAIKEHIVAGTYDARLDINVDGVVTFEDLSLLAKYYVYTYTYAELFAEAIAYDPAI